jgi:hypothetical protein
VPDETRCTGIDVAICANESFGNRAHAFHDSLGPSTHDTTISDDA